MAQSRSKREITRPRGPQFGPQDATLLQGSTAAAQGAAAAVAASQPQGFIPIIERAKGSDKEVDAPTEAGKKGAEQAAAGGKSSALVQGILKKFIGGMGGGASR